MWFVVGISGVSGSGKSSLSENLAKVLKNRLKDPGFRSIQIAVLHQDDYYYEHGEEELELNWESPAIINNDQLIEDIERWKQKVTDSDDLHLLIVEGFLVYGVRRVLQLCDFCLFLHVSKDTCKRRRFQRDEWIRKHPQYFDTVWSEFTKYNKVILSKVKALSFEESKYHFLPDEKPPLYIIDASTSFSEVSDVVFECFQNIIFSREQPE